MRHVSEWAQSNNLRLNTTKSVELIIHRPGVKLDKLSVPPPPPPLLASLERPPQKCWELSSLIPYPSVHTSTMWLPDALRQVLHCAFLGLMVWMAQHFGVWNVTRSTLVSKLLYASPVWFGYLDKESRDRCQSLLNRLKRWGFLGKDFENFITLCENADDVLFSALLLNETHVLHQLLPPEKSIQYNLRNRPHNYTLPIVKK